ncbi:MAG TPA: sialidase family protein [Chloroflexota bacterium]|jgi:hypothetical protein|nr:sialidase family protein [Chloroflexota bacterium]
MERQTLRPVRLVLTAAAAVAALGIIFSAAAAHRTAGKKPVFASVVTLTDGKGHPATGGEPSIAADVSTKSGVHNLYIVSPNQHALWSSYDSGKHWSAPVVFDQNGPSAGGDTDVAVSQTGHVIVTDLDVSHAWVQVSTDHGKTFNTGIATAPEDDRPWLTTDGANNVYVSYHDFVGEIPIICASTDGGMTFPSCTQTFSDPTSSSQCAENTVPARGMTVDPTDGSLNFMYSCATTAENAAQPPYGPLHDYYLAKGTPTLLGGVTYQTYPIFQASTSNGKAPNFANIFGTFHIDSEGNYYAIFAGTFNHNNIKANPYHIYLVTSTNHGKTWSKPKQIDHGVGTNVLADFAVTRKGDVDVVWYHSPAVGDSNGVCGDTASQSPCPNDPFYTTTAGKGPGWRVYMAQTDSALTDKPKWTQVVVNPHVTHYGEICTNGIVCGSSDRSLLDFISVAVDCKGSAHITYAANPNEAKGQAAYLQISNQTGGHRLAPPKSCAGQKVG